MQFMYMPTFIIITQNKEERHMNLIFYMTIFLIGILFGSFYTLAVFRIPKKEDIVHTHSYCPKCNHKLGFLDLIPVFSYLFLGGKCRYCKEKIRPRYFILEIISGIVFVSVAFFMGLTISQLTMIKIIEFSFFVLYFTFLILMAGMDKEHRKIEKSVLMYGIIVSILYIIYLYIVERTSIYRYGIYLVCFVILLLIDTLLLKKKAKDSYSLSILMVLMIMAIFTGEYITIHTAIITFLAIAIWLHQEKRKKKKASHFNLKSDKEENEINEKKGICAGLYLTIANISYYLYILGLCQFLK